jgi:hypothetical protein
MKTFLFGIIGIWIIVAAFAGCTTSAQRTGYNTIAGVEATASAALDGYLTGVIKNTISTNDVPKVTLAFDQLQAAATLAAAADQAGTNALAPAALNTELTDFTTLIETIKITPK